MERFTTFFLCQWCIINLVYFLYLPAYSYFVICSTCILLMHHKLTWIQGNRFQLHGLCDWLRYLQVETCVCFLISFLWVMLRRGLLCERRTSSSSFQSKSFLHNLLWLLELTPFNVYSMFSQSNLFGDNVPALCRGTWMYTVSMHNARILIFPPLLVSKQIKDS